MSYFVHFVYLVTFGLLGCGGGNKGYIPND